MKANVFEVGLMLLFLIKNALGKLKYPLISGFNTAVFNLS